MQQLIQFKKWPCFLVYSAYGNNQRTCMYLVDVDTGEIIITATVNISDWLMPAGHVLIKDWSENHGILDVLETAGIVKRTGQMVPSGYVRAHECVLLLTEVEYSKLPYGLEVE